MRLEDAATLTRAHYTKPFRVYRGARLSKNEVEELRVGTLVATNGYMSSSIHLNVAQVFISIDPTTGMSPSRSRDDKLQCVLFAIDINLTDSPEINVADVSDFSAVSDEKEVLFDLGTTFIITTIEYDIEHRVWHIRMVSSSEMTQLRQDYSAYINRRLTDTSPTMMFGHLLSDISSDYAGAMNYFHHLLRTIPVDNEDRPTIYFYLARIYRFIGKHKTAIEYFRCALLLQKRKLPQSSMGYGRALAGLATTYSELGESTRAVYLYERAIAIHRAFLPSDHFEMAMESNRLAYAYWQEKQYERALAHLSNVLIFYKRTMPVCHPGQAQALHTMGLVYHALGNREQALDYYTQALHMRESLLSDDHPFVARTCYQLSLLHAERHDERIIALDYAQRALNIRSRKLPPNHDELNQSIELVKQLSEKE
jgi:tetratricopeptide (TPR) repeat protein